MFTSPFFSVKSILLDSFGGLQPPFISNAVNILFCLFCDSFEAANSVFAC